MTIYNNFSRRKLQKQTTLRENIISNLWSLLLFIIISIILIWGSFLLFAFSAIEKIPSINNIDKLSVSWNITMYDRDWNEIYSFYDKEKRSYISYTDISPNMINAIVSIEDKTFFENNWFDLFWLFRASYNYISGKTDKIQGTSTIWQQLIKNMLLTNERSLDRKIQELYLSYKLTKTYTKDKILEMYLNKIFFWNNSYWIEEASKIYFNKSAKDLSIIESSILASLPKWPSYYSPFSNKDKLMGYFYIYNKDNPQNLINILDETQLQKYNSFIIKFKDLIKKLSITEQGNRLQICNLTSNELKNKWTSPVDKNWCISIPNYQFISFLNSIQIKQNIDIPTDSGSISSEYIMEYQTWRKDLVLDSMYQNKKITIKEYIDNFEQWFDIVFIKNKNDISMKYPYFVLYVKDFLEKKYWNDLYNYSGLKIYTTLNSQTQDALENILEKQAKINSSFNVNNAALLSIDNKNWQIISMIWWKNFYWTEEWSQINMILSKNQPWSSFKPIEYALAISKYPIWPETPIYDVPTTFKNSTPTGYEYWTPKNYDLSFNGVMSIKTALWNSRNIPAAKIFELAGWVDAVTSFANELWIDSLKQNNNTEYWAALSLWSAEIKPIEMAQAYSVFANLGYKKDITPILKIIDWNWNVIENNDISFIQGTQIFSNAASYIITNILSDPSSRPSWFWNNILSIPEHIAAAKTWTSDKEVIKNWKNIILPKDLWTIWYTPQYTTVVWAGNTDWKPTSPDADGLNCAAPIWEKAMIYLHKDLKEENWIQPETVMTGTISKITGKIVKNLPSLYQVKTIFAVNPISNLRQVDSEGYTKDVDFLCLGPITDKTPENSKVSLFVLWDGVEPFIEQHIEQHIDLTTYFPNMVDYYYLNPEICDRQDKSKLGITGTISVPNWTLFEGENIISITIQSVSEIQKAIISFDWNDIDQKDFDSETNINFSENVNVSSAQENHLMKITLIDINWYDFTLTKSFVNQNNISHSWSLNYTETWIIQQTNLLKISKTKNDELFKSSTWSNSNSSKILKKFETWSLNNN